MAIRLLLTIVLAKDTLTRGWILSDVWTIMRQCHFQSRLESNSIYHHHRRKMETIFKAVSWIKRIAHFLSIDDDKPLILFEINIWYRTNYVSCYVKVNFFAVCYHFRKKFAFLLVKRQIPLPCWPNCLAYWPDSSDHHISSCSNKTTWINLTVQ